MIFPATEAAYDVEGGSGGGGGGGQRSFHALLAGDYPGSLFSDLVITNCAFT